LKQMELQADAQKFQADQMAKMAALNNQHQDRMAELQANLGLQATNDARDSEREQQRAAMDAQVKAIQEDNKKYLGEMQAAIDKYRADLQSQTQLALANMAQVPNVDVNNKMDSLAAALQMLAQSMTADKELVVDPKTGRKRVVVVKPTVQ
jgi:hypothetical protein